MRTIIGAEVFHGPVRDGKGWDHLAMVIRLNGLLGLRCGQLKPIRRVLNQRSFDGVSPLKYGKRYVSHLERAHRGVLVGDNDGCVKVIGSSRTSN